jgi:hypothetical protein
VLYQLSYAPRFAPGVYRRGFGIMQRVGRFGLPLLFSALTLAFAVIAFSSADHAQWVIAIAAVVMTLWMGSFALASLRRTRR